MEFNKKGQEVKYIKTEDLKKIREYLKYKNKITFLAFINIGVNVGLRISDLSTLRFENIDRRSWTYTLIEKKTKKKRLIKFNAVCKKSIKELEKYYEELEYSTKEGYLFKSLSPSFLYSVNSTELSNNSKTLLNTSSPAKIPSSFE